MYGDNVATVYRSNWAQGWSDALKRGHYVYWIVNNDIRVGKISTNIVFAWSVQRNSSQKSTDLSNLVLTSGAR